MYFPRLREYIITYKKDILISFIFFCVMLIVFWRALFVGFFSDDYDFLFITAHQDSVLKYFATNYIGQTGGGTYAPLLNVLFTVQYKLFGMHALGYHMVSFVAYFITALLIYFFAKHLSHKADIGFAAGFLFIILHNHASSLAWVAVQPHVFATLFFLVSIFSYYLFVIEKKKKWYIVSLVSLLISVLIKEIGITGIGVILLIELFYNFHKKQFKKSFLSLCIRGVPFVGVMLLYLALRYHAVGYVAGYYAQQHIGFDLVSKLKMFVEMSVHIIFSYPYRFIGVEWLWRHKVVLTCVVGIILFITHCIQKEQRKNLWFLLCAYVVATLPFLSVQFSRMNDENERYIYLVSVFAVIFSVLLVYSIVERLKWGRNVFVFIIALLAIGSMIQLQPKLSYWEASAHVRDSVFKHTNELSLTPQDVVVFVGLPDNLSGAQLFRNAIRESLSFETQSGYIDGERIPLYTFLNGNNFNTHIVDVEQQGTSTWFIKPASENNQRIFTGFKTSENEYAVFTMNDYQLNNGYSGKGIVVTFKKEKIDELKAQGRQLIMVYFDEMKLKQVVVSDSYMWYNSSL